MLTEDREQTLDELESTFELPPETIRPAVVPTDPAQTQMTLYGTSLDKLRALEAKCSSLTCADPRSYDDTRRMIGILRSTRGRIEKLRKEHNAEHQEAIRFVNGIARQLTDYVCNLEDPLKEKKAAVDDAKEREKRAKAEAERKAIEDKIAAERAAEAELNRIEAERLAAERAAVEAERAALAAERRAIDDARAAVEAAELKRQAAIKAEREEAERIEQRIREAEATKARERERVAALAAWTEAIKPDLQKLKDFAQRILLVSPPVVISVEAKAAVANAVRRLGVTAKDLMTFQP